MRTILESDEEFVAGGLLEDHDQLLMVKAPHTTEDAIAAINDINNYGQYVSSMRSAKVTDKDLQAHFGPSSPRAKAALEKKRGEKFPNTIRNDGFLSLSMIVYYWAGLRDKTMTIKLMYIPNDDT